MEKITAFLLAVLIALTTGADGISKTIQSVFDHSGLPYCFGGRLIAETVRLAEENRQVIPTRDSAGRPAAPDDTGDGFGSDENVMTAQTWVCNELTLTSDKTYADPFNDADVDLILAGNGVKYVIPGFWDGGNTWKVRFVCPSAGQWYYETVCTDEQNKGLNAIAGRVDCAEYDGDLEIYKRGFVTSDFGKKYLTYADGSAFFYLGDTHWSLGDETTDMVTVISEKRASQGFTVWQSEPIGAGFNVSDGITAEDMAGFADYDTKFKTIADAGLTHANACFFFPSDMHSLICFYGGYDANGYACEAAKRYLEKATRYWVARYGSYPVLWTLGQETDNDFYNFAGIWTAENNPYKFVAEYVGKYDAYCHPLSAHMEYAGSTAAYGSGRGTDEKRRVYAKGADASAFRDVPGHDWYAAQWHPSYSNNSDYATEKEFWYNSQGKPVINYEGCYDGLWTKTFGARMQGWASFLGGMFGYGWGAHDTWSYLNVYDEENDTWDGVDHITSEEKKNATWQDALERDSAYQCGYMKDFFTSFDWWNLIPRFGDKLYFWPDISVKSYAASNADNSEMVIYFFSFSDPSVGSLPNSNAFGGSMTGRIGCLEPGTEYHYRWFNPLTGEFSEEGSFTSTAFGTYQIGQKTWNGEVITTDMVFYMYK